LYLNIDRVVENYRMFFLFEYIDPLIFLVSLCAGLFYTYVTAPEPKIIYKYPTPFNSGKVLYQDDNKVCYKYKIQKASCPKDQSKITNYKFQANN
jgi:hypothetical protein